MQITSLTIGGDEWISYTRLTDTEITHAVGGDIQTAEFVLVLPDSRENAVVGLAAVGLSHVGHGITVADEVIASAAGMRLFAGRVSSLDPMSELDGGQLPYGSMAYRVGCQDYTYLLDTVVVASDTFTAVSDASILTSLFATYLPSVTVSASVVVASVSITFADQTLRQCVEEIAKRTGADWRVNFSKVLEYGTPGTVAAPFGFSDDPDYSSTREILQEGLSFREDFQTPANTVIVKGKATETHVGTVTVPISVGTDDGCVNGEGPTTTPPLIAVFTTGGVTVSRSLFGSGTGIDPYRYSLFHALLRFDTSVIPDDATITEARLVLGVSSKAVADSPALGIDYYDPANWPIDAGDYFSGSPPSSPTAFGYSSIESAIPDSGPVSLKLANLSNISKTGYTGFRMFVQTIAAPVGANVVTFFSYDDATAAGTVDMPKLEITYTRTIPEVVGSFTNTDSVAKYTTLQKTIIDRTIQTVDEANLRAEYEARLYGTPVRSITMQWRDDGILIGQSVPISSAQHGVDGNFVCKKLTLNWITGTLVKYSGELGSARPDLVRLIRSLAISSGKG